MTPDRPGILIVDDSADKLMSLEAILAVRRATTKPVAEVSI